MEHNFNNKLHMAYDKLVAVKTRLRYMLTDNYAAFLYFYCSRLFLHHRKLHPQLSPYLRLAFSEKGTKTNKLIEK